MDKVMAAPTCSDFVPKRDENWPKLIMPYRYLVFRQSRSSGAEGTTHRDQKRFLQVLPLDLWGPTPNWGRRQEGRVLRISIKFQAGALIRRPFILPARDGARGNLSI